MLTLHYKGRSIQYWHEVWMRQQNYMLMTNAFLMHRIPLWPYMCEAQSAIHDCNTQPNLTMRYGSHSIPHSPMHSHTHICSQTLTTQTHNPSLPQFLSIPTPHNNHQSDSEDVSSKNIRLTYLRLHFSIFTQASVESVPLGKTLVLCHQISSAWVQHLPWTK